MSQHNYDELVAFAALEAAKPFAERVELARVLDFDIHKPGLDWFHGSDPGERAFQFQEDCVLWGKDHGAKTPVDTKPGNMKVKVYAANHVPKGVSPWIDLEQVPAWKAGKIQE